MSTADPRAHSFTEFFRAATRGFTPHDWQRLVALEGLPDVLPVPTGLGKTEVALAWAWRSLRIGSDRRIIEPSLIRCGSGHAS